MQTRSNSMPHLQVRTSNTAFPAGGARTLKSGSLQIPEPFDETLTCTARAGAAKFRGFTGVSTPNHVMFLQAVGCAKSCEASRWQAASESQAPALAGEGACSLFPHSVQLRPTCAEPVLPRTIELCSLRGIPPLGLPQKSHPLVQKVDRRAGHAGRSTAAASY